ncbi:hypothetical protein [Hydrogenophaga sp. ANAO-22]|uniref:hypothetical protein n=1 Tax=Hydrogenophaga sp. ANAO-22 TaxID=3166645 RepID=UPI0036D21D23
MALLWQGRARAERNCPDGAHDLIERPMESALFNFLQIQSNFSARLARTNLAERSPAGSVRNTRALSAALLRHPDILKKNSQPPFDSSQFRFETKCGFWS